MVCDEDVSHEEILIMQHKVNIYVNVPLQILVDCTILVGLYIVFVHNRASTKPWFVKVIWVFLVLSCATNVTMRSVKR